MSALVVASLIGIPSILAGVYAWWRYYLSPNTQRPTIACDMDEVLCDFLGALIAWHNMTYGTSLTKADFKSYHFHETWGGTLAEGVDKVHLFFRSPYFAQIQPVPGAAEAVAELKKRANLVVVTSRQHVIAEQTLEWLNTHFPGIFSDVLFGNHYAQNNPDPSRIDATKRTKADMCKEAGALALVDDNVSYCTQCAPALETVVLFGRYGWNDPATNAAAAALPPNVAHAADWRQAGRTLHALLDRLEERQATLLG